MNQKGSFQFLHTADLHLGIDLPKRKKKKFIWSRAQDFLQNFYFILSEALHPSIDFLLISGDIFDRSKPPKYILLEIWSRLIEVSTKKPVIIIPGNHDRSFLNSGLFKAFGNLQILNSPNTVKLHINDLVIGISGFPYIRNNINRKYNDLISLTNHTIVNTDYKILMLHQLVESARVGIQNYEFKKSNPNVLSLNKLTDDFDYYALGHVHRFQEIHVNSLKYSPRIVYSGSIERTAFQEREEQKGYVKVKVDLLLNQKSEIQFQELPNRSMFYFSIDSESSLMFPSLKSSIEQNLSMTKPESLVQCRINSFLSKSFWAELNKNIKEWKVRFKLNSFKVYSKNL